MPAHDKARRVAAAPADAGGFASRRRGWGIRLSLASGLLALLGGLALGKWWCVSPPEVQPVIRVSGLDLWQARALAATARRLAREDQSAAALSAWREALGNNPADLELWREVFRYLRDAPHLPASDAEPLLARAGWFLRLGGTNAADVALAARVCARYEEFERLLSLPAPAPPERAAELALPRLEGLFRLGRMHEFIPLYRRCREAAEAREEFAPYREAYLAGWGEPAKRATHRERLKRFRNQEATRRLGAKLELIVARHLQDAEAAGDAVRFLAETGEVSLLDRALLWQCLILRGRQEEAWARVRDCDARPASAVELNQVAAAWMGLGLTNRCARLLERFAPAFGRDRTPESANVWMTWAGFLMQTRQWNQLRQLGATLRALPGSPEWLRGYADFVEGYAAYHLAKQALAEDRLRRAAEADYPVGNLGIGVANGLSALERDAEADALLRRIQSHLDYHPAFWRAVWNAAFRLHNDAARLLEAATRLRELEPQRPMTRFNYAAALLVNRRDPAEALSIFWDLRQKNRSTLYTELNYALALIRNQRRSEALAVLNRIDPDRLNRFQKPTYHLCWLEWYLAAGRARAAREALKTVKRQLLFPSQLRWLEDVEAALAPTPAEDDGG